MIDAALKCIAKDLNDYLRTLSAMAEEVVVVSGLMNSDGSVAIHAENKIVLTLINIQQEKAQGLSSSAMTNALGQTELPLQLNLEVLFSANFSGNNYTESLHFISEVVAFFERKNVFTISNTPNMDPRFDILIIEMVNQNIESLSKLWLLLGTSYIPSVLYKIRVLQSDESVSNKLTI